MKPLIAIVGRPNVGKSMLFNKLVGQRLSIVEDTPGVTRDRLYAEAEWRNRKFDLVDTGGIEPETNSALLRQIDDCLRHLDDPKYMQAYRACSCVINQPILVKEPHGTYEAFAEDIDEQGRLLIRCGSEKKYLCSGEISIRPISSR